jgi:hypothetical protein
MQAIKNLLRAAALLALASSCDCIECEFNLGQAPQAAEVDQPTTPDQAVDNTLRSLDLVD